MQPDDEVCLCFHVTLRKLVQFIQRERVQRVSQLSQCLGAGTGCGWCRPILRQLVQSRASDEGIELPDARAYARNRAAYIRAGKGSPPEAT